MADSISTATEWLFKNRTIFYPENSPVKVDAYQWTRIYKIFRDNVTHESGVIPRSPRCTKTTFGPGPSFASYLDWINQEVSNRTLLIVFDRLSSTQRMTATRSQFDKLADSCPSFDALQFFASLFVDDHRSICYPSPIFRQLQGTVSQGVEDTGFEILYGFPYFENEPRKPRKKPGDEIDWPLRRSVVYHRQFASVEASRRRSLWILISGQDDLEQTLKRYLEDAVMQENQSGFKPHVRLQHSFLEQWRPPIVEYTGSLRYRLNCLLPERITAGTKAIVDQAWNECLQRTDMVDYLSDFVHAAEALTRVLQCLQTCLIGVPTCSAPSDNMDELTRGLYSLLEADVVDSKAIRGELMVLRGKAERIAMAYSRLTELRSEDFNNSILATNANTTALKDLNRAWERESDAIGRQNHINSNVSRFLGLLGATLLPVGLFGSFFAMTKIVDDKHNWWLFWVTVLGSWAVMVILIYIWGRHYHLWVYGFWVPVPQLNTTRYDDVEEGQRNRAVRPRSH